MSEYVSITLSICSEETDPDTVTHRVGLQPTGTRKRGTPTRNGMLRRPEFDLHEWWIRRELPLPSGVLNENEAEAFIKEFLDQFADNDSGSNIYALSMDHDVLVALVCLCQQLRQAGGRIRYRRVTERPDARPCIETQPPCNDDRASKGHWKRTG